MTADATIGHCFAIAQQMNISNLCKLAGRAPSAFANLSIPKTFQGVANPDGTVKPYISYSMRLPGGYMANFTNIKNTTGTGAMPSLYLTHQGRLCQVDLSQYVLGYGRKRRHLSQAEDPLHELVAAMRQTRAHLSERRVILEMQMPSLCTVSKGACIAAVVASQYLCSADQVQGYIEKTAAACVFAEFVPEPCAAGLALIAGCSVASYCAFYGLPDSENFLPG